MYCLPRPILAFAVFIVSNGFPTKKLSLANDIESLTTAFPFPLAGVLKDESNKKWNHLSQLELPFDRNLYPSEFVHGARKVDFEESLRKSQNENCPQLSPWAEAKKALKGVEGEPQISLAFPPKVLQFPLLALFNSPFSREYFVSRDLYKAVARTCLLAEDIKEAVEIITDKEYEFADNYDVAYLPSLHLFLDPIISVPYKGNFEVNDISSWVSSVTKLTATRLNSPQEINQFAEASEVAVLMLINSLTVREQEQRKYLDGFDKLMKQFVDGLIPVNASSQTQSVLDIGFAAAIVDFSQPEGQMIVQLVQPSDNTGISLFLFRDFENPTIVHLSFDNSDFDQVRREINQQRIPLISDLTERNVQELFSDGRPVVLLLKHPKLAELAATANTSTSNHNAENNELNLQDLSKAFTFAANKIGREALFVVAGTTGPTERRLLDYLALLGHEWDPNNIRFNSRVDSTKQRYGPQTGPNDIRNASQLGLDGSEERESSALVYSCEGDVVWILDDFRDVPSVEKFRLPYFRKTNARGCDFVNGDTIVNFYHTFQNRTLMHTDVRSDKIPQNNSSVVYELVGSTFWEVVDKSTRSFFVLFYASWCGHSRRVELEFREAATKAFDEGITDVVFAKIDITGNDVDSLTFESYPTVAFFSSVAKGEVVLYDGVSTAKQFLQFVRAVSIVS